MIISAPGKIVLWGEYAVLAGAPAAVMAIDRYASCALKVRSMFSSFVAHGFLTPGLSTPERVVPSVPVTSVFVAVLKDGLTLSLAGQILGIFVVLLVGGFVIYNRIRKRKLN